MRRFECFGDLLRNRQRVRERECALRNPIGERGAFDKFEGERLRAVRVFEAVDRRDVRVIERREDLRLALKAGQAPSVPSGFTT